MIRRPPRSTHCISSAASDVYKRQDHFKVLEPVRVTNLVLFVLFALSEVWCLLSNIKACKVRVILREISVCLLYICMHWIMIIRCHYCLGIYLFPENQTQLYSIESINILAKDLFVLVLAWRAMEIMYSLDDSRKYLMKFRFALIIIALAHFIAFTIVYIWRIKGWPNNLELKLSTIYLIASGSIFSIIYIYTCIETIRFWRQRNMKGKLVGYLKLLFGIMIYMILALLLRLFLNISFCINKFNIPSKIFLFYSAIVGIVIEAIPCVLMSLCLYMMAKESEQPNEEQGESLSDIGEQ
eukprot:TRINITY_DN8370_c0_g1_i4.p1 TRINITY_DN8370_c0_g1~~TRINITY_DN8370_c0_g1_i4.p1  ORF type:complete len:304 (-),score=-6.00 TRINITY_DN8370_c0_g1_i4:163-1053(-)